MIFDFHNDLLSYLAAHPYNSPLDSETRASLVNLREGAVRYQVFVLYTPTAKNSAQQGVRQAALYTKLLQQYAEYVERFSSKSSSKLQTILAIENISGCFNEDEPFEKGIARLKKIALSIEKPLYASLTWNQENRFGGGAHTKVGLKADGKRLLEEMQDLCTAIDLSHASDPLAYDILSYCDKKRLTYRIMASHSNFRKVCDVSRNLSDEIAAEIVRRKGIISLNLIRPFLGDTLDSFLTHVEHAVKNGWEGHLGLGADFFSEKSIPSAFRHNMKKKFFFDELPTAAQYPMLVQRIRKRFGKEIAQKICCDNAMSFIREPLSKLVGF